MRRLWSRFCLSAAKSPKDYNNHLYKITCFVKSLEQQRLQTLKFKVLTTQITFLNDFKSDMRYPYFVVSNWP